MSAVCRVILGLRRELEFKAGIADSRAQQFDIDLRCGGLGQGDEAAEIGQGRAVRIDKNQQVGAEVEARDGVTAVIGAHRAGQAGDPIDQNVGAVPQCDGVVAIAADDDIAATAGGWVSSLSPPWMISVARCRSAY